MKIETLQDLDNVLLLCHKRGVHAIVIDGISLALTPRDPDAKVTVKAEVPMIDGRPMTDDEVLFWSAEPREPR